MPRPKKHYHYPCPEKFKDYRKRLFGNDRQACADYLHLSERTVRAYENSQRPIPYVIFKLMRLKAAGRILDDEYWDNYTVSDGVLYGPAGESIAFHEVVNIPNLLRLARKYLEHYRDLRFIEEIKADAFTLLWKVSKIHYKPTNQTGASHG